MGEIEGIFPNMVAGVITDRHGFPMATNMKPTPKPLDEELLALSAVSDRKLLDLSDYHKVVRPLSHNVRLMVLLEKTYANLHRFKAFNRMLEEKNPI